MSTYERRVMELFDAGGLTKPQIAEQTGYSLKTVDGIIGRLQVTAGNPFDDMVRQGSKKLMAALLRHHPDICGRGA